MSKVGAIVAIAENGVIGNGLEIPWHISEDFKHFKRTTTGGIIVMGRRTWESLGSKPLPNRENVVITSCPEKILQQAQEKGVAENVRAYSSLDSAIDTYKNDDRNLWIIGGAKLYESALDKCDEMLVSHVKMSPQGDIFFPQFKDKFEKSETILTHSEFDVVKYIRRK
ncbi:MAG: dihydrofolate reductase [Opitutales bacterium]|nr:dihydrofolate reductase [Opitutales bacterium]MBP3358774.1 dihydrofolate reductase [Opitutales bacterium]MBQ2721395.1 dihydrofolate reductase [Opitutales bacterium]MBR7106373.1 dihydrofolate reductase [Opitutales bacterium]